MEETESLTSQFTSPYPFTFECGKTLPEIKIAYTTYGNPKNPPLLVCHTLTGCHHITSSFGQRGWWEESFGKGKLLDPEEFYIVCSNVLGGCFGSSGPSSLDPTTHQPYGLSFPFVTVQDMVRGQKLLMDHLKIPCWEGVIGGCLGGFQALFWTILYPGLVKKAMVIATTHKTSTHTIALFETMRQMIYSHPSWHPYLLNSRNDFLFLPSLLSFLTSFSKDRLEEKFGRQNQGLSYSFEPEFAIEKYLRKFSNQNSFCPYSLIFLTKAMDYFDLASNHSLEEIFHDCQSEFLFISYEKDWRYPPDEIDVMARTLKALNKKVSHSILEGSYGHSSFIFEPQKIQKHFSQLFLPQLV